MPSFLQPAKVPLLSPFTIVSLHLGHIIVVFIIIPPYYLSIYLLIYPIPYIFLTDNWVPGSKSRWQVFGRRDELTVSVNACILVIEQQNGNEKI